MNDYQRIEQVIHYLVEHRQEQPGLNELATVVGLSGPHLQRLFSRWAGVSPKTFLQLATFRDARSRLERGASVLDAALDVGLSGPGRLHDLCVRLESASPGEIKSGGAGWTLVAGFAETPLGQAFIVESPRGITRIEFIDQENRPLAEAAIRRDWPQATIRWDESRARDLLDSIFHAAPSDSATGISALVRGTEFQLRVWSALLRIPRGDLVSYGRLAQEVGCPGAARAVGTAVGRNPLAFMIPCHRVIRETGVVGNYRWGSDRKRALMIWEAATLPSLPEGAPIGEA